MNINQAMRLALFAGVFVSATATASVAHTNGAAIAVEDSVHTEGPGGDLPPGFSALAEQDVSPRITEFVQVAQNGTAGRRLRIGKPRQLRQKRNTRTRSLQTRGADRIVCTEQCPQHSAGDAERDHDYVGNYNFKVELD